MLKRHLLSLLLISSIGSKCISDNQQKFNTSNAVIAWDFHDVLVKKDWPAMITQMFAIIKSDWKLIGLLFWPSFWKEIYEVQKRCGNSEELLSYITDRFPSLKPHWHDLLILINLHTPISDSIEILKNLKKQGYENYLASNMGKLSYDIQKNKFPDIFAQFDGHFMPEEKEKPCREYYIELRDYLIKQKNATNKTIIFIDNSKENIEGAKASNHDGLNHIHGIVFTSPQQLKTELDKLIE